MNNYQIGAGGYNLYEGNGSGLEQIESCEDDGK
jgi:hypothetical protein